jgi:hypothetical protein
MACDLLALSLLKTIDPVFLLRPMPTAALLKTSSPHPTHQLRARAQRHRHSRACAAGQHHRRRPAAAGAAEGAGGAGGGASSEGGGASLGRRPWKTGRRQQRRRWGRRRRERERQRRRNELAGRRHGWRRRFQRVWQQHPTVRVPRGGAGGRGGAGRWTVRAHGGV